VHEGTIQAVERGSEACHWHEVNITGPLWPGLDASDIKWKHISKRRDPDIGTR